MKTYVISDIHGCYHQLMQCFDRAKFDYEKDKLIFLGDVCDRGPNVKECVGELLKIKNLINIRGNHDQWFIDWLQANTYPEHKDNETEAQRVIREAAEQRGDGSTSSWMQQGGNSTLDSYEEGVPETHFQFFMDSIFHYIDEKNRMFVHGGFNHREPIEDQDNDDFMWDRQMIYTAKMCSTDPLYKKKNLTIYEEVYIGHTPVLNLKSMVPLTFLEVTDIDTGVCYGGKLSLLNIDTKELYQSDQVQLFSK